MPLTIRLKDTEQARLEELSLEVNKDLISKGIQPVQISTLIHFMIEEGVESLRKEPGRFANKDYRK